MPVVIVVPEIWGMHEHIKDVTQRLAKAGYFAVTNDPYFRIGDLKAFGNDRKSQIHVYEGMPHAFNADYRPSYRKEAADDGWKRMLAWFNKNGVA